MLESEIYEWLESKQIPVPEYKVFGLDDRLDVDFYPVVLKIQSAKVIHKTEVGGVMVNLENAGSLSTAKLQIIHNLGEHGIEVDGNDKFIISHMYRGIELFFGMVDDPVFGKVIVFGAGGVLTELFRDVCFIDIEADDEEIIRAIFQTKISVIFKKGFRGCKYDIGLVLDLIKKLQSMRVQELDLNPVILQPGKLTVVDARILEEKPAVPGKKMRFAPEIFNPANVAIIGASNHPEKVGYALAKNTANSSCVYLVNRSINTLFGKKVYHSVNELPAIDTAVLAIPAKQVKENIEQLAAKGVRNIIIITAGFKEAGCDETFFQELVEIYNINIIGPNCLGAYVNNINLTFGAAAVSQGQLNIFSQSGAILAEIMDKAAAKNIGFENIISVGNMADIDFGDLINSYKGLNPINLYVEGVQNGKNLLRAIRGSKAPVRIFKAGQTEAAVKAAFSHTGNMAGNYQMFCGLLKSIGATVIKNVNGLLYPYSFNNVLVITNAGGPGTIISDLIAEKLYKLSDDDMAQLNEVLPPNWSKNNPVDIIGDASPKRFKNTLLVADRFGADAIYVIITPQYMTDALAICKVFTSTSFSTKIFPVLLGGGAMVEAKNHLKKNNCMFFEELNEAVSFL